MEHVLAFPPETRSVDNDRLIHMNSTYGPERSSREFILDNPHVHTLYYDYYFINTGEVFLESL